VKRQSSHSRKGQGGRRSISDRAHKHPDTDDSSTEHSPSAAFAPIDWHF